MLPLVKLSKWLEMKNSFACGARCLQPGIGHMASSDDASERSIIPRSTRRYSSISMRLRDG